MTKTIAVIIAFCAMMWGNAFGQLVVTDPVAESPLYVRLDVQHQASKDAESQKSLTGKIVYGEYAVNDLWYVTLTGYHDQEFWSVYPGLAIQATEELQLGLGGGRARYDGQNWTVWNPWAYWEKDDIKAFLYAEYTPKDHEEPWYFKGYVEKRLNEKFFAGVYGESFLGVGPMLGTYLTEKVKIWAMVPMIDKRDFRLMAGLSIEF